MIKPPQTDLIYENRISPFTKAGSLHSDSTPPNAVTLTANYSTPEFSGFIQPTKLIPHRQQQFQTMVESEDKESQMRKELR